MQWNSTFLSQAQAYEAQAYIVNVAWQNKLYGPYNMGRKNGILWKK